MPNTFGPGHSTSTLFMFTEFEKSNFGFSPIGPGVCQYVVQPSLSEIFSPSTIEASEFFQPSIISTFLRPLPKASELLVTIKSNVAIIFLISFHNQFYCIANLSQKNKLVYYIGKLRCCKLI